MVDSTVAESALEFRAVSKHFGGVAALSDVDLHLRAGEVHGLLGQNGSGKSTLIKILAGYHVPDRGSLSIFGDDVALPMLRPQDHGVAVIHQDLGLVESMTVLENVGISDAYGRRALAAVHWGKFRREVRDLLRRLDCPVSPDALVRDLRGSDRSMVAIARSLRVLERRGERHVFVLDEPTAYLGVTESDRLMRLMRRVADEGSAVLFVSHKLGEVLSVTDRCTILRDGEVVTTVDTAGSTARGLVSLQLGRELGDFYPPPAAAPRPKVALGVEDLSAGVLRTLSCEVREGEILGLTGLVGMGQDEALRALAGAGTRTTGRVVRHGVPVEPGIRAAVDAGLAMVPEDRKGDGLWLEASARENFMLPASATGGALRRLRRKTERTRTTEALTRVSVRPLAPERPVGLLSGGNQQKVLLAKWLSTEPGVLLLHEPTQGVDAAARREILELVNAAAEAGTAVVVASTDYEQLAHLCHRVLVLRDGVVVEELTQPLTDTDLLLACQGGTSSSAGSSAAGSSAAVPSTAVQST
ncbi:sugar ABC transporter ATP-binding protein [Amycolatopsis rhabdoformis]|uniref:Sugar ABC transporter ATP-binding protein n=1 Tax=Amycolatopsis rhabdoformis TaxID=1448059 RepID=A0ABZ1IKI7_9PSEU|nr:sugar ABC transporter ATP-binding protein [Amycolatopsis rhabdoformis]WSE34762.1 sugar ABC transporter ATP-binding protein [Amycolatopsis rhabdoformis]